MEIIDDSNLHLSNEDKIISIERLNYDDNGIINWIDEIYKRNFMPAIILIEKRKISVDSIVNENTGDTILHCASYLGYYNVIRVLIEKFNANINIQNYNGWTALHILCTNYEKNIYIFSYLIKNENLLISITDYSNITPFIYSIIYNFHFAFLYFITLESSYINYHDQYKNSLLYYAIVNNNKYVLEFLLYNFIDVININEKYYNGTSELSDILITNKNNQITKFLMKYYWYELSFESLSNCKKNIIHFPFYNRFNYELINTIYFYKTGNTKLFLYSLFKFNHNFKRTTNQRLFTQYMVNNNIYYKYKYYNLKFLINDLILPNYNGVLKIIIFLFYLLFIAILNDNFLNGYRDIKLLISLFISFLLFNLLFCVGPNIIKREKNLLYRVKDALLNKITDLPSIDETCPCCMIVKKKNQIHCHQCKTCIDDLFFHSNLFSICFTRKNIKYYLLFLISLIYTYYNLIMKIFYTKENKNKGLFIIFYFFISKYGLFKKIYVLIFIFLLNVHLTEFISIIICLGCNVPYKNMYKYTKKIIGNLQLRKNLYYQIPQVNTINICTFIKNIFKSF